MFFYIIIKFFKFNYFSIYNEYKVIKKIFFYTLVNSVFIIACMSECLGAR